jgi:hypothetical protein
MKPINTLNHIIEEFESYLEELSLDLKEEINYEPIHKSEYQFRSQLQSDLEEKKQHLNNLKEIKKTLEELSQDDSTASQDAL